jgi:hypothetical protein
MLQSATTAMAEAEGAEAPVLDDGEAPANGAPKGLTAVELGGIAPLEPALTDIIVTEYEGERDEGGRLHGEGSAKYLGGHTYEGQFQLGRMHGDGKYTFVDGTVYEGEFVRNAVQGKGKYTWADQSTYDGEVDGGLRHGHGIFVCVSCPSRYEGQWVQGKREGDGTLYYDEKKKMSYSGQWDNGARHGQGTMVYKSGNKYSGSWEKNQKHGKGTMSWIQARERYEGQWENDKQGGHGEHLWMDSAPNNKHHSGTQKLMCNRYSGQFSDGMRHGLGTFSYANGSTYNGGWIENQKQGTGVFTFDDGSIYEGPFEKDRMVGPKPKRQEDPKRPRNPKEVDLHIDDLIPPTVTNPKLRERAVNQVNNTLLQSFSECKAIYNFYAKRSKNNSKETFTISMSLFWKFCKDAKFPTKSMPIASIDRILQVMRRQQMTEVEIAKEKRRLAECGETFTRSEAEPIRRKMSNMVVAVQPDLHDPDKPILFREFLEAIVRIADSRFAAEVDENALPLKLAARVQKLLLELIIPEVYNEVMDSSKTRKELTERQKEAEAMQKKLSDKKVVAVFDEYNVRLNKVFFTYAKSDKGAFEVQQNDSTMNVREYLTMLRDCSVVDETTICEAKELFIRSNFEDRAGDMDDDDNLETELIYSEFKEAIVRLSDWFIKDPVPEPEPEIPEDSEAPPPKPKVVKIPLHEKIETLIKDSLLPGCRKYDVRNSGRKRRPAPKKKNVLLNRAFVFVKPHACVEKVGENVVDLVRQGLGDSDIRIVSEQSLDAATIDSNQYIDNHYGAIASKAVLLQPSELTLSDKASADFKEAFGMAWGDALKKGIVYNAKGACEKLKLDEEKIGANWKKLTMGKDLLKFGGGFYCGKLKDDCFVINAFYMAMRAMYTTPPARIHYFCVEWDPSENALSWEEFRAGVIGPTDPTKAPPTSLRGTIFKDWKELGLEEEPNTALNGVHASAGPFEGLVERINWCGTEIASDRFGEALLDAGVSAENIAAFTKDPQVTYEGNNTSLFDLLEDVNADECIAMAAACSLVQ